jgi:hypothetical protein
LRASFLEVEPVRFFHPGGGNFITPFRVYHIE